MEGKSGEERDVAELMNDLAITRKELESVKVSLFRILEIFYVQLVCEVIFLQMLLLIMFANLTL